MTINERISSMEAELQSLKQKSEGFVTKEYLRAEIAEARLKGLLQGREEGYKKGAFIFGTIGAICTLSSLAMSLIAFIGR